MAKETTYYKLSGVASTFVDMTQPKGYKKNVSASQVVEFYPTKAVKDAFKAGAIEKATEKEYKDFVKTNKAAQEDAEKLKVQAQADRIKTQSNAAVKDAIAAAEEAKASADAATEALKVSEENNKKLQAQLDALTAGKGGDSK